MTETAEDKDSVPAASEENKDNKFPFYVYCNVCHDLRVGKLRVRCSKCKSGAITVDSDPKSWDDVLKPKKISGHCEQDDCAVRISC